MPLVVWFPFSDLVWLAEDYGYFTRLRSYKFSIDVGEGLPHLQLRVWYGVAADLLINTASPTYAPLTPSAALIADFGHGHEGMVVSGAESSWPSTMRGKLSIHDMVGFLSTLNTYIEFTRNRHLNIGEEKAALYSIIPPRLLPQLLL